MPKKENGEAASSHPKAFLNHHILWNCCSHLMLSFSFLDKQRVMVLSLDEMSDDGIAGIYHHTDMPIDAALPMRSARSSQFQRLNTSAQNNLACAIPSGLGIVTAQSSEKERWQEIFARCLTTSAMSRIRKPQILTKRQIVLHDRLNLYHQKPMHPAGVHSFYCFAVWG